MLTTSTSHAPGAFLSRISSCRRASRLAHHVARCDASAGATGSATLKVTLKRPLGIVFAERKVDGAAAGVFVEELTAGGNAEKAGVRAGDVLLRCSAVVLKAGKEGAYQQEGYGAQPYTNFDRIMFDATAQRRAARARCRSTRALH